MEKLQNVRALLRDTAARFRAARLHFGHGTSNASDEAAWLVLHALGLPYDSLPRVLDRPASAVECRKVERLVRMRIKSRKPLAYLLREAWLGPHRFYVDERVIVPRSFIGELLRDGFEPWLTSPARVSAVMDLCTGSGCLAVLAALTFPNASVDALDISRDALAVARQNVKAYRLSRRIRLLESDLLDHPDLGRYDLILSNPPYVNAAIMRRLPEEYRREPELALASGQDGLDAVRRILADAPRLLKPGGLLVVEIGHNRAALEKTFPKLAFTWLETSAGNDFVFLLERAQLVVPGPARKRPHK